MFWKALFYQIHNLKNLQIFFGKNSKIIDCTFTYDQSLQGSLDNILKESEIAVRQGTTQLILTDKTISEEKIAIPIAFMCGSD